MRQARTLGLGTLLALMLAGVALAAGVKVQVQHDKSFDFAGLTTYAWRLDGANPVKLLQGTDHDPEQIRKNVEPPILAAIDQALAKRGFKRVPPGESDLFIDYYVLVGPGVSAQTHGQFVGAIPEWGLPDFVMSTSALKIFVQGSLIIDIGSVKQKTVVWRGYAEAELDSKRTQAQRVKVINDVAEKMLQKFPPKYKPEK
jgi:hypothetical protein